MGKKPLEKLKPEGNTNPRYVSADVLNLRSAPGTDSQVVGKLTDGTQVNYTGNKTEKIDGHLWAEVTYDGKTGWVAADYLKTAKPQSSDSNVFQNESVAVSASPEKPAQSVSVDSASTQNKIDINDHAALQEAFNNVRKPGATDGDLGDPGDFDGVWGLQCVDLPNWFLTNFTTLGKVGGNGKDIVKNIANKHNLAVSTIPTAPAIYSVDGYHRALGTRGTTPYGHTGVIVDVKDNLDSTYTVTFFHTYSTLNNNGYISEFKEETITPNEKVTFVNIGDYISQ